ncbi:unnamed protein product [Amoebophrya sp. A120]|nr:unnamed protein product [Amoebophrya sp. A120]|eukprot:GSA120T00006024001.1
MTAPMVFSSAVVTLFSLLHFASLCHSAFPPDEELSLKKNNEPELQQPGVVTDSEQEWPEQPAEEPHDRQEASDSKSLPWGISESQVDAYRGCVQDAVRSRIHSAAQGVRPREDSSSAERGEAAEEDAASSHIGERGREQAPSAEISTQVEVSNVWVSVDLEKDLYVRVPVLVNHTRCSFDNWKRNRDYKIILEHVPSEEAFANRAWVQLALQQAFGGSSSSSSNSLVLAGTEHSRKVSQFFARVRQTNWHGEPTQTRFRPPVGDLSPTVLRYVREVLVDMSWIFERLLSLKRSGRSKDVADGVVENRSGADVEQASMPPIGLRITEIGVGHGGLAHCIHSFLETKYGDAKERAGRMLDETAEDIITDDNALSRIREHDKDHERVHKNTPTWSKMEKRKSDIATDTQEASAGSSARMSIIESYTLGDLPEVQELAFLQLQAMSSTPGGSVPPDRIRFFDSTGFVPEFAEGKEVFDVERRKNENSKENEEATTTKHTDEDKEDLHLKNMFPRRRPFLTEQQDLCISNYAFSELRSTALADFYVDKVFRFCDVVFLQYIPSFAPGLAIDMGEKNSHDYSVPEEAEVRSREKPGLGLFPEVAEQTTEEVVPGRVVSEDETGSGGLVRHDSQKGPLNRHHLTGYLRKISAAMGNAVPFTRLVVPPPADHPGTTLAVFFRNVTGDVEEFFTKKDLLYARYVLPYLQNLDNINKNRTSFVASPGTFSSSSIASPQNDITEQKSNIESFCVPRSCHDRDVDA